MAAGDTFIGDEGISNEQLSAIGAIEDPQSNDAHLGAGKCHYWLPGHQPLAIRQQTEQQCPAILRAIAAWIGHIRGQNGLVEDPLAADLLAAATSAQPVLALFGKQGVLASSWKPSPSDIALIMSGLR